MPSHLVRNVSNRPRVALIIDMSRIYGRRIVRGIGKYVRTHEPWSIFLERREYHSNFPRWLTSENWDGVICRSPNKRLAEAFQELNTPVVDLNDWHDLGLPRIWSDNLAIGRLGAEHLLDKDFRKFAFYAFHDEAWATKRQEGFVDAISRAGYHCVVYKHSSKKRHSLDWNKEQENIASWIQSMATPLGLMASNDHSGQHVLDACRRADLRVPEEVAVIGVDNEEEFCELCDPPLSSVDPHPERVGHEAAELLDRLITGDEAPKGERLIEPLGVIQRQSTEILGIEDSDMVNALSFIREHACKDIKVHDVVRHVLISRSALERRFRKYLGRSPQEEIRRVQLRRIKQLLTETDMSLEAIAHLTGYTHPEYMSVAFKRMIGLTPGAYRKKTKV